MRALVLQYYVVLRSVLRSQCHLRRCLRRCRHCRIFFLTHPRNAGRQRLELSLWLPEAHRKRRSTERSVAYYDDRGRQSEEEDAKRQASSEVRGGRDATTAPETGARWDSMDAAWCGYVRMVASLIEGRRVSEAEILEMLVRALRQHSMARRRRMDYVVA